MVSSLKLSRIAIYAGLIYGVNSLTFAEEIQKKPVQWTDESPLYGQHAWEKNLLRHHIGGRVFGTAAESAWNMEGILGDQTESGRALISDDPTISVAVPKGERNFDYSFGQRFLLRRVVFMSEGLAGTVEVFVAATDPVDANGRWVKIASQAINAGQREQIVKFAAVDARYFRLSIRSEQGGKIFGLGTFGIRKAVEFYDPTERGVREDPLESIAAASASGVDDFVDTDEIAPPVLVGALDSSSTNTMSYARVEMVSSSASGDGAQTALMLDEDSTSNYQFAEGDPSPTVVIDLGKSCDCGRVSVLYNAGQAGAMTMWIADPRNAGAGSTEGETFPIGGRSLQVKLKRTVNDLKGDGRLSFNEFRRAGRYLVLQWRPSDAKPRRPAKGFGVNEIALFEHQAEGSESVPVGLRELVTPAPEPKVQRPFVLKGAVADDVGFSPQPRVFETTPVTTTPPVTITEPPVSR